MTAARSNQDWIDALGARGPAQSAALASLRSHLLRVLPASLDRRGGLPADLLEDVVQETLVRVLDHLDEFEGRSRFTTWATTIAVRGAMTELRRKRWKDVSLDELVAKGSDPSDEDSAPDRSSPEELAARGGIVRRLLELVESDLSERQRTAILAELGGMPQEEIGRRLGLSRNAVYKLGHDARRKLQRGLEASGFDAAAIRAAFTRGGRRW